MQTLIKPTHQAIRTVLHLSPSVTTAALKQAQRHEQGLGPWLEHLVVEHCESGDETAAERRLHTLMVVELFANVASNNPGALQGRWLTLFHRCQHEPSLWKYPRLTVEEIELGIDGEPFIDAQELLRRWPELVASVWLS